MLNCILNVFFLSISSLNKFDQASVKTLNKFRKTFVLFEIVPNTIRKTNIFLIHFAMILKNVLNLKNIFEKKLDIQLNLENIFKIFKNHL